MSQIKGKDTKPEKMVRKFLYSKGFRFRLHVKKLPGDPDIVLPKYKIVIFIHGCFWHGHENCKYFKIPKTRSDWWIEKITGSNKRDSKNQKELLDLHYKVITIWECELTSSNKELTFNNLVKLIHEQNKN